MALTPFKRQLLVDWAWRIVSRGVVEHDETESFVGFLQYACITKPPAALFLRRTYQFLHVAKCWSFFLRCVPGLPHKSDLRMGEIIINVVIRASSANFTARLPTENQKNRF